MTMPSIRLRNVSRNSDTVSNDTASSAGISRRSVAYLSSIGLTRAVAPITRPILTMFEPMALPNARPGSFCRAATTETRISGAEVANATTVRPIISGATPRFRAVAAAPCTKRSAPQIRSTRPAITRSKLASIEIVVEGAGYDTQIAICIGMPREIRVNCAPPVCGHMNGHGPI